ncbi:hypothetical protein EJ04DRAFT_6733 [Polyplosphaeria fusca]|uniref:Uncharacterized protein n=1 Tax=Polyplosphaeria fusca TaxID=682080 RepID=A0A9P4R8R2_9PLEO|nr:hypothetical protein EJ04DRAFT_6733 [Polyplosphaeria fusca]
MTRTCAEIPRARKRSTRSASLASLANTPIPCLPSGPACITPGRRNMNRAPPPVTPFYNRLPKPRTTHIRPQHHHARNPSSGNRELDT